MDLEIFKNKKVLMLQGPTGYFFKRLSFFLKTFYKTEILKINFCGGDKFFFPDGYSFNGTKKDYENFITKTLKDYDAIMLFGEYREQHVIAKQIAKKLKKEIYVFEEGYIRPNYITLEKNGVNANSNLINLKKFKTNKKDTFFLNNNKPSQTKIAFILYLYNFMNFCFSFEFSNYKHHRNFGIKEAFKFSKAWLRRRFFKNNDNKVVKEIINKEFFFVPLQVSIDSQVLCNSNFEKMENFIKYVIEISNGKTILFKDHPLEIEENYKDIINKYKANNIYFIRTGDINLITKNAKGIITINSTVGLNALFHYKPVFCLGKSFYVNNGLATNKNINDFILNTEKYNPNKETVDDFKNFILKETQIKGSFY